MKVPSSIELSKSWWAKVRPEGLKKSGPVFEKAVADVEQALKGLEDGGAAAAKAVEAALAGVRTAAKQVAGEAGSLAGGASDKAERKALEALAKLMEKPLARALASIRDRLDKAAGDGDRDDDDDDDGEDDGDGEAGAYDDPEAHGAHLQGFVSRLRRGPMSFALAMPTGDPATWRMEFAKKAGKGKSLRGKLASALGTKKCTWGTASAGGAGGDGAAEAGGRTLVLSIDGPARPGLTPVKLKAMLKALGLKGFGSVEVVFPGGAAPAGEDAAEDAAPAPGGTPAAGAPQPGASGIFSRLRTQLDAVIRAMPDMPEIAGVLREKSAHEARQLQGDLDGAIAGMRGLIDRIAGLKDDLMGRAARHLEELAGIADPEGATPEEKAAMQALRDRIRTQLGSGAAPTLEAVVEAGLALVKLRRMVEEVARLATLARTNPKAAEAARKALAGFDAELGGEAVTPEAEVEQARLLAEAEEKKRLAEEKRAAAEAMPNRTKKERAARAAAIKAADGEGAVAAAEIGKARAKAKAMQGRRLLGAALGSGPLSVEAGRPLSDDAAAKFVAAFAVDPVLADRAVQMAATSEHPETLADGIGPMCAQVANGFASDNGRSYPEAYSRFYATNLLRMGGAMGGDYFDKADAYIKSGAQFEDDPFGDGAAAGYKEVDRKRSAAVAGALLGADGKMDPAGAGVQSLVGHMKFNPDVVRSPTPVLAQHVERTLATFADPTTGPQAQAILDGTAAPTNPQALELIRRARGKAAGDPVSDAETRQVVLAAMLTPVDQQEVGSCFASAGVRRMRETDPIKTMEKYTEIATKGRFTPANNDPAIPAVTAIPAGDDPLVRSLEYSAATVGARIADSNERNNLSNGFSNGLGQVKAALGDTDIQWVVNRAKLRAAVATAFTFQYNATVAVGGGADGSSSLGRYELVRVSTKAKILTKADYVAALTEVCLAALDNLDRASEKGQKVVALVQSDAFINATTWSGAWKPWDMPGGGFPHTADEALFGGDREIRPFLGKAAGGETEGARTEAVLANMLGMFSGRGDAMIPLDTAGIHVFNGLPQHPSLDVLEGDTPDEVKAKIAEHLTRPGEAARDTDMGAAKTRKLYDEQVAPYLDAETDATLRAVLAKGIDDNRPAGPLSPKKLRQAVEKAIDDYAPKKARDRADKWKKEREDAGAVVSAADYAKALADFEKGTRDRVATDLSARLVTEVKVPEFVIADTNWGSGGNHTFFVVAPDPTTGEARLWTKTVPPGTLRPAERKWVDTEWARVE